jgi:Zn-dependent protease with chaperone function
VDERGACAMDDPITSDTLPAEYFDGRSAQAHRVRLQIDAGRLRISGDGVEMAIALAGLKWPERTRHGARMLHLQNGACLHSNDGAAWDAWSARVAGRRDSFVVRVQQRWRWVAASLLVLALLVGAGYRWGVPAAARALVALLPPSVDGGVGDAALAALDEEKFIGPSTLAEAKRQAIRQAFSEAAARLPASAAVPWELKFRKGLRVGPNAFALPGGTLVLTDELVERVNGDHDMLVGVLGHELGHLRHRHGMRMLVQAGIVGAATGALFGDFSSLLALVPTWLAQASYSRDAEREADAEAVQLLRANGISPAVMARFFDVVHPGRAGGGNAAEGAPELALASHPADAERKAFFERAAAQR